MSTPNVTLRPATLADLDAFEQRFDSEGGTGPHQWFGHGSLQHLRDAWEERRLVRRAQWRGGRWHDQLLLSLLRDERRGHERLPGGQLRSVPAATTLVGR